MPVYQRIADKSAMYPHVVFDLENLLLENDLACRHDYELIIDLYFLKNPVACNDAADEVIELLNKNSKVQKERIEKRDKIYQDLDCRLKSVINKFDDVISFVIPFIAI